MDSSVANALIMIRMCAEFTIVEIIVHLGLVGKLCKLLM